MIQKGLAEFKVGNLHIDTDTLIMNELWNVEISAVFYELSWTVIYQVPIEIEKTLKTGSETPF